MLVVFFVVRCRLWIFCLYSVWKWEGLECFWCSISSLVFRILFCCFSLCMCLMKLVKWLLRFCSCVFFWVWIDLRLLLMVVIWFRLRFLRLGIKELELEE